MPRTCTRVSSEGSDRCRNWCNRGTRGNGAQYAQYRCLCLRPESCGDAATRFGAPRCCGKSVRLRHDHSCADDMDRAIPSQQRDDGARSLANRGRRRPIKQSALQMRRETLCAPTLGYFSCFARARRRPPAYCSPRLSNTFSLKFTPRARVCGIWRLRPAS
jgi:hypothetical protein